MWLASLKSKAGMGRKGLISLLVARAAYWKVTDLARLAWAAATAR